LRNSSCGTTEASRRFNCSKATHGIVALFDATMVLLQPIIEILIGPMLYAVAHRLAYGPRLRNMPIGCDLIGNMANNDNSLLEKALGCLHIPLLTRA